MPSSAKKPDCSQPLEKVTFARVNWHVLYLRPRCEKKMAEYCGILGLKYYLPLRRETKLYQRRKVTVDKPVFPGYFFASFERQGRLDLLKTNIIVRILKPDKERQFLHELAQIRKALSIDSTLGACTALKRGIRVRIRGGPFMGIEGLVLGLKGTAQVRLNIDMIGQAVAVEVDRELLEVID
jgi:transcriptional antiterminator RfaH